MFGKRVDSKTIVSYLVFLFLLAFVFFAAAKIRLRTASTDIPLDYDPWWFYRHAKEIITNFENGKGLLPNKWDVQSYFPPGRPEDILGWSYTIAVAYLLVKSFISMTLAKFSVYFIVAFVLISLLPAYIVGRMTTNKWGGLATVFFMALAPSFVLVSMAGYIDSDVVYVFYTYLTVATTLYAINKGIKKIEFKHTMLKIGEHLYLPIPKLDKEFFKSIISFSPYAIPSLIAFWFFAFSWNSSWYIYFAMLIFSVFYFFIAGFLEPYLLDGYLKKSSVITGFIKAYKVLIALVVIGILGQIATMITNKYPFHTATPLQQLLSGLRFLGKKALIVNISVAELQTLNPFTKDGFLQIASRVGLFPTILSIVVLPLVVLYKLWRRHNVSVVEWFIIFWLLGSLWLITRGVRFGLLFTIAVAAANGFVVGELVRILRGKNVMIKTIIFGMILFGSLHFLSSSVQLSRAAGDMSVDKYWRSALDFMKNHGDENTLVATWWDPGHIIAGYTGLKVYADGAHCGWGACIPYNLDIRIQDMGRILTTSDEDEAYNILKKYTYLTQQQCEEVEKKYPKLFNRSVCEIKINKIYFIASADLIGKYYWPYYFASCLRDYKNISENYCYTYDGIVEYFYNEKKAKGDSYNVLYLSRNLLNYYREQGINNVLPYVVRDSYGREYELVDIMIINNTMVPLLRTREGDKIIRYVGYLANNTPVKVDLKLAGYKVGDDGLLWIDNSLSYVIYADKNIANSLFTKMFFFNGEGLKHFKLVFNTPEVKIFEVDFK